VRHASSKVFVNPPRVFADGTLTVVMGPEPWPDSIQVYAGPHKLSLVRRVRASVGENATEVEVSLAPLTGNQQQDLKTEQEARLLAALRWLQLRQD
jgi:hypothetical protein